MTLHISGHLPHHSLTVASVLLLSASVPSASLFIHHHCSLEHPGIRTTNPQATGQGGQRTHPRSLSKLVAEPEFQPRRPGPHSRERKPRWWGQRGFEKPRGLRTPAPHSSNALCSPSSTTAGGWDGGEGPPASSCRVWEHLLREGAPTCYYGYVALPPATRDCLLLLYGESLVKHQRLAQLGLLSIHSANVCQLNRYRIMAHTHERLLRVSAPEARLCLSARSAPTAALRTSSPPFTGEETKAHTSVTHLKLA